MLVITTIRDEVSPKIANIINAMKSGYRSVLLKGGQELLRQTRSNFSADGPYHSSQWAPLSRSYARKVGHIQATDKESGALYVSIKLSPPYNNYISVYTRCKYAAAIAFGVKNRNLPPRNFWPFEIVGSPSAIRPTLQSDRDLYNILTREWTVVSRGSLPYLPFRRSTVSYGNPFKYGR